MDELVAHCRAGDFRVLLRGATQDAKWTYQSAIFVNDWKASAHEEESSVGVIEMSDGLADLEWCVQGGHD